MTPEDLASALHAIVVPIVERRREAAGITDEVAVSVDDVVLERPKNRDHGDWACNIAMKLAKRVGANPRELAQEFADALVQVDGVASVEVAGPGFINVRLDAAAAGALAKVIVDAGDAFGRNDSLAGQTINIEFVSANPTGPLHIGHTRWAALGDSLARVLSASGATLVSEYYINDAGNQMDTFADSILAAAKGEPTPEGGYPGAYIGDLAKTVLAEIPDLLERPDAREVARERAYALQLGEIRASLERFNVHFDVWFSERTLHATGEDGTSLIDQAVDRLREQGHVFDEEGAVWVRTTDFGDDKNRVIRR
ncbi:MAG: arginine--tRNA ligase, partial [Plantibacter flavus]